MADAERWEWTEASEEALSILESEIATAANWRYSTPTEGALKAQWLATGLRAALGEIERLRGEVERLNRQSNRSFHDR